MPTLLSEQMREHVADPEMAEDTEIEPVDGPLVVATDATSASDSAMRLARRIAARSGQRVLVVSVLAPTPIVAPEVLAPPMGADAERREALRSHVEDQLVRAGIHDWPIDILSGDPATQIVRYAITHAGSLVLMGLGEHGLLDRLLGDETVLRVLRLGTVPVLAVAPGFDDLPARVVAATDFTPSSVRAAGLAARIMRDDGTFTLAHVVGEDTQVARAESPNAAHAGAVGRAFDLALERAGLQNRSGLDRCVLAGDAAGAVIDLASRTRADLIVAGSHGHGFLTRLRLGSVSQKLVRAARCSVLVAPPADGPNFLDEVPAASTRFAAYEWAERLEEFSRRNAGRRGTLEVFDREIGAQVEEAGFPFQGATFDTRDGRVQIMLGDGAAPGRHLTRSIPDAYAVQVLRDRSGRDIVLRVAHARGQTLLTLER